MLAALVGAEFGEVGGEARGVEALDAHLGVERAVLFQEGGVVGVDGVDDGLTAGDGDLPDLPEEVEVAHKADAGAAAQELREGDAAEARLEGQPGQEQLEELVVLHGEGLDAEVVQRDEGAQAGGFVLGEAQQVVAQGAADLLAGRVEAGVLVQGVAGGVGAQVARVEDALDEEGPVGHEVFAVLAEEHAAQVDAVPSAHGEGGRPREDVGDAAYVPGGRADHDGVEGVHAEQVGAPVDEGGAQGVAFGVGVPGGGAVVDDAFALGAADRDGVGQQGGVARAPRADAFGVEVALAAALGAQDDAGTHGARGLVLGVEFGEGVLSVGVAGPADRRGARDGAGDEFDLVGDDEAGEQADAELSDEVAVAALAGAPDGGEEGVDAVRVEADAVVLEGEDGRPVHAGGEGDGEPSAVAGLGGGAGREGVDAVLKEFSQVHLGSAVEVFGEQVDHASQVDLEGVPHKWHLSTGSQAAHER